MKLYNLAKVLVIVGSDTYEGTVQKVTPSGNQAVVAYGPRLEVVRFHRNKDGVYKSSGCRLAEYEHPCQVGLDPNF